MKKIDQIIVTNIRHLMKERGLSQIELSRRSGKSAEHLNKVLAGTRRPGDELLEAIATHLGVESWELYQRPMIEARMSMISKDPLSRTSEIVEAVKQTVRDEFAARDGFEHVPAEIMEALKNTDGRNWDAIEHLLKPANDTKSNKLKSSS